MTPPNTYEADCEYRLPLAVRPSDLPVIRRKVTARLRLWGLESLAHDACAIITELLTNVHRHANGRAVLLLQRWPGCLCITVSDTSREMPLVTEPDWASVSGRGMFIVASLANWWKAVPTSTGKDVIASLVFPEKVRVRP
ncbi:MULTISPECIES: ATP-binding protein [unclassified Streptomyces]|uniref:ATP-binding protein n=1 Tax=unclassified Streptomyces TaxID=2593676 RepID=UPI003447A34C